MPILEVMVLNCSARDANFFPHCVVNIWNALPSYIVHSPSIATVNMTRKPCYRKGDRAMRAVTYRVL